MLSSLNKIATTSHVVLFPDSYLMQEGQCQVLVWRLFLFEFRTQYSSRSNSNGPSPLHGQIQMSAEWGKICGQIPQRGDSRSVQMPHLCQYPPPLSLGVNIDLCITLRLDWFCVVHENPQALETESSVI